MGNTLKFGHKRTLERTKKYILILYITQFLNSLTFFLIQDQPVPMNNFSAKVYDEVYHHIDLANSGDDKSQHNDVDDVSMTALTFDDCFLEDDETQEITDMVEKFHTQVS